MATVEIRRLQIPEHEFGVRITPAEGVPGLFNLEIVDCWNAPQETLSDLTIGQVGHVIRERGLTLVDPG